MSQKIEHAVSPELGKYDFDGGCAPHSNPHGNYSTFTLGIFQWQAKQGYYGRQGAVLKPSQLKRTKVFKRVVGQSAQPQAAYDEARRLCTGYNNGALIPPLKHANE